MSWSGGPTKTDLELGVEQQERTHVDASRTEDFLVYVNGTILPATKDLENLKDAHRKHLQKLVYTNLVDRFDSMIDALLLEHCRTDYLADRATHGLGQQITEAELLKLLMRATDLQDAVDERLCSALRNSVLRERHSRKLSHLLDALEVPGNSLKPRVNISTGEILEKIKPQQKTVPYSICGYADWLYSRRNTIVHGAGKSSFLQNDIKQMKKLYKCTPAKRVTIKPGSIRTTAKFYSAVVDLLEASPEA